MQFRFTPRQAGVYGSDERPREEDVPIEDYDYSAKNNKERNDDEMNENENDERLIDFDAAREQAMIAAQQQDQEQTAPEQTAQPSEQPVEQQPEQVQVEQTAQQVQQPQQQESQPEQGQQPAEQPQQQMSEADRAVQENQQLRSALANVLRQNQQMQEALNQMSESNEQAAEEEVLTPPTMDFSNLWSEDENVIKQKEAEYAQRMAEYTEKKMMKQLAPLIEYAQGEAKRKEMQTTMQNLSKVPATSGIMGMTETLERILNSNPTLSGSDAPLEDKLITAYAIAKGADAIQREQNPPAPQPEPQPTIDDFMRVYAENPDLQRRIEAARAAQAAKSRANVPPMSASAGAFNAALSAPEEPKTFEDAKRMLMAKLGM